MTWPLDRAAPGLLEAGDVAIWRVAAVTDLARAAALEGVLSEEERARAARMLHPLRRAAYTVTRALLRRILGRYTGVSAAALRFRYSATGKPTLPDHSLHFSVSHAGDGALVALSHAPVGVDLEQVRPRRRTARMLDRLFSAETRAALAALPPEARLHAFHWAWTQREAHVKAVGGGLFATPDVLPWVEPGAAAELVSERGTGAPWTVIPLRPWPEYCAAAVAAGVADCVRLLDADALDG